MQKKFIKKIFEDLTNKSISKTDAEEFEGNLREYFSILIEWLHIEEEKGKNNEL